MNKIKIIKTIKAECLEEYKVKFMFSDGKIKIINFKNFLSKSKNPMSYKYLNLSRFKDFKIKYGDVVWGDYEMCFPIWDLYKGKI